MSRLKIAPPPPPPAVEEPAPALDPVEQRKEQELKEHVAQRLALSAAIGPVASKSGRLKAPPKLAEAPSNMHLPSDGFVDLNFKVEPELRQRFKMEAVRRGMSNKDFLAACFQVYLETFPSSEGYLELKGPTPEQRRKRIEARKERIARMERLRSRQG